MILEPCPDLAGEAPTAPLTSLVVLGGVLGIDSRAFGDAPRRQFQLSTKICNHYLAPSANPGLTHLYTRDASISSLDYVDLTSLKLVERVELKLSLEHDIRQQCDRTLE